MQCRVSLQSQPLLLYSERLFGRDPAVHFCSKLCAMQAGVALASASDLTFNWTGFISAMVSNLTFGFRAVWSKK